MPVLLVATSWPQTCWEEIADTRFGSWALPCHPCISFLGNLLTGTYSLLILFIVWREISLTALWPFLACCTSSWETTLILLWVGVWSYCGVGNKMQARLYKKSVQKLSFLLCFYYIGLCIDGWAFSWLREWRPHQYISKPFESNLNSLRSNALKCLWKWSFLLPCDLSAFPSLDRKDPVSSEYYY